MFSPELEPQKLWGNMHVIAIVLDLLDNLAMEQEFSERLHELSEQAWESFPCCFTIEYPE